MTDTNKEREEEDRKKAFIQLYDDRDSDYAIFTDGWNAAVKYGFLGDRAGQAFENAGVAFELSEDGTEWTSFKRGFDAATLQPQLSQEQTMGREEIERLFISREVFVDFLRKVVLNGEWSNETGHLWQEFYDHKIVPLHRALSSTADPSPAYSIEQIQTSERLSQELGAGSYVPGVSDQRPAPLHPVEGELTREEWLKLINDSDPSMTKLWERIQGISAATEARVREEMEAAFQEGLQETEDAALVKGIKEAEVLRATISDLTLQRNKIGNDLTAFRVANEGLQSTIADLNAKLETAVQPEELKLTPARFLEQWSSIPIGDTVLEYYDVSLVNQFVDQFRPTPKTLTNSQKSKAWVMANEHDYGSTIEAWEALMDMVLSGKSIDELYAEVAKGGEK